MNQVRLKRLILYSSIAQIGFIVTGMATNLETDAFLILFFVLIYLVTSVLIWGCIIFMYNYRESVGSLFGETLRFFLSTNWRKFQTQLLWLIIISLIFFSIGGIPPLVGFISKFSILLKILVENLNIAFILLIISSISVYYYIRVLKVSFFEPINLLTNENFNFKNVVNAFVYIRWDILGYLSTLLVLLFIDPSLIIDISFCEGE